MSWLTAVKTARMTAVRDQIDAGGGVDGQRYQLTNTVVTSAGRTINRVITLNCTKVIR